MEEDRLRLKSRECWMLLGDKNTKFFHSVVKTKHARDHISNLISESGTQVSATETLKAMALDFYNKLFNHSGYWNVFPKLVVKKKLTYAAAS